MTTKQARQRTGWFSPTVQPVRDGVYERDYSWGKSTKTIGYCAFVGGIWYSFSEDINRARRTAFPSVIKAPWRGLVKP